MKFMSTAVKTHQLKNPWNEKKIQGKADVC